MLRAHPQAPVPGELRAQQSRDALMSGEQQVFVLSPIISGWLRGMWHLLPLALGRATPAPEDVASAPPGFRQSCPLVRTKPSEAPGL